jgi:hypothetical protein
MERVPTVKYFLLGAVLSWRKSSPRGSKGLGLEPYGIIGSLIKQSIRPRDIGPLPGTLHLRNSFSRPACFSGSMLGSGGLAKHGRRTVKSRLLTDNPTDRYVRFVLFLTEKVS